MKTKFTFWKLLNENFIEIPIIQRDYAQGRESAKEIRTKLLEVLCETIQHENKSIELDFVYGRIKDGKFIPLDGQQRLTTLFLIHWYLASKENKFDEETIEIFKKFTYETRVSSREFCEKLVSEKIALPVDGKNLTNIIKNKNWFFESWEKDPTIKSMLTMIDAIHEKFKGTSALFDKLISVDNSPITFQFLDLEEFKLTDELYIKMNARGKPLTAFENFKANFEKYLTKTEDKSKLDNAWTDLFWNYVKDTENKAIDELFLNFFTNITLSFYVEDNDIEEKKLGDISIFDIYEDVYSIENNVGRIIKLLNELSCEACNDIKTYFEVFIGFKEGDTTNESESKLSYWDRARFYAIALFLIKNGSFTEKNQEQFFKWKRVTFNLINNTLIQRPEEFVRAIKSLKILSENMNEIYEYLSSDNCKIDFYLQLQVEEEKIKAKLMENHDWKAAILDIEKHWYFDGQIGFILEFSKDNKGQYDIGEFQKYSKKCEAIFNKKLVDNDEHLVHRALLAKGDYLVEIGRNCTFCSFEAALRTKNDNWRKVFNDQDKRTMLKSLLDDILLNNIRYSLDQVINDFQENDWRIYFVKNPKIILYCKKLQTRFYNIGDAEDNYEILLLSSTQTNGYHAEYYTYALYLALVDQKVKNMEYQHQKSESSDKSIKIGSDEIIWDGTSYKINNESKKCSFEKIEQKYVEQNDPK